MDEILEIVKIGDDVLREKCTPVKEFDSAFKMLTSALSQMGEEIRRPLEKRLYLLWGFPLKKLRAGGYQRIDKPCAVLAGSAPGLLNPALNEVVIASLRLDDMEVVFAPACVNVGIAGILFFLSFVMGFQRPCRVALVLLKP